MLNESRDSYFAKPTEGTAYHWLLAVRIFPDNWGDRISPDQNDGKDALDSVVINIKILGGLTTHLVNRRKNYELLVAKSDITFLRTNQRIFEFSCTESV